MPEITEIAKKYDPKSVEDYWAKYWIDHKIYAPDPKSGKPSYVIVIPPPNVTGSLHMGHALNNVLQDILIRWKKMCGYDTLWVPGTDHGGIATQNVVEKLLKAEKKSRHDLGREKFLERMWQWREKSGDTILMQLKRLGCLLDWSRMRFTMDEVCSQAVVHAFIELYKKGWIYRGNRMVNWCVRCNTALSDIEVEYEDRKDKLYHIRYPILSGVKDGWQGVPLVVATTRPETMLGDTAVAVHPDDPRYEKIHGWWVQLPLVDREILVISDELVDPKFGTGVIKVTPAHDPADFEMGLKHNLEQIVVIGYDGKMNKNAGKFAGLSREVCRKKVLEELEKLDLIEKVEDYPHSVGTCYRCGVAVEPLVSEQWFLKVGDMAKEAAEATKSNQVKIFPQSWTKPYLLWLDNLKDWCISRQIWWGHRIPIWYCVKEGSETLSADQSPKHPSLKTQCPPITSKDKPKNCEKCKGTKLEQDPDVLDTWFSSALWPFSVFHWPQDSVDLKKYYPTSVLVTGHEILYLWVARMVMFGLTFDPNKSGQSQDTIPKRIPYSHVFIHGIVRDKQGKKMSKSLGNVVDPLTVLDKYGTDSLRFVLASQSVPGRDMQISDENFLGARNFTNKIWNVSRFALMGPRTKNINTSIKEIRSLPNIELCDQWIITRYQKTVHAVHEALGQYNIAQTTRLLYQFIWSEFCDWYIELSKIRIQNYDKGEGGATAVQVRDFVLSGILKMLHPIMPFITEELWKNLNNDSNGSLCQVEYPKEDKTLLKELENEGSEAQMQSLMNVIVAVRTIRAEMNVPPAEKISLFLNVSNGKQSLVKEHTSYIQHLCKTDNLKVGSNVKKPKKSASAVTDGIEIFIPLEGLIDFEKEKIRIEKDFKFVESEVQRIDQRLSNQGFRKNAPPEEIARTEQRKQEALQKLERLKEHLSSLETAS